MAKVLIVDDNIVNRRILSKALRSEDHQITEASNGYEALLQVEQYLPDLILLDVTMPEMDGFEASAVLRKKYGRLCPPIIAMTAHAMAGDRERCLANGMDDYVSKPVKAEILRQAIRRVTEKDQTPVDDFPTSDQAPTACSQAKSLFDLPAALQIFEGDIELFREIAYMFVEDWPRMAGRISESLRLEDMKALAAHMHTLSGLLGQLAAEGALGPVTALQSAAGRHDVSAIQSIHPQLERRINTLRDELLAFLNNQGQRATG